MAAYEDCVTIAATNPGLAHPGSHALAVRSIALAGVDRLEESVDEAATALEFLRREGETTVELGPFLSHGDAVIAPGRTQEAAETWRRFLTLATSPETSGTRTTSTTTLTAR